MRSRELYLRLLRWLLPHRRMFLGALAATVVLALTEPALPALMKPLLDGSFVRKDERYIVWVPLALVGLFVIRGLADYASGVGMRWVAIQVVMDLRRAMFERLLRLPVHALEAEASGITLSKLTYDVGRVMESVTTVLVTLVKDSLIVLGLTAWVFYLNWKLALMAFLLAPPTALIVRWIGRRLRYLSRALQMEMGALTQVIQEGIQANRVIKIYAGEATENRRFHKASERVRRIQTKAVVAAEANVPLVQLLTVCALAIVVYLAARQAIAGALTVGGFVSLVGALALMSSPIKRLSKINEQLQAGLAASESVFGLLDRPPEADPGQRRLTRARGQIELRGVSFTYPQRDEPALADIDLAIHAGSTLAVVGPSGSGKTTLAQIIPRFVSPGRGVIRLDGIDIAELRLADLRAQIAYVGQQVLLFDATVAENIAYGALGTASPAEIEAAARAAHAWEFIAQLPQGLDTRIGENGVRLSGGQRQRIAIARAFIKDAPVLILDEATSALDSAAERAVQSALAHLAARRTCIVIAHRLSTVEQADHIVVLEAGRIAEQGTHARLLARNGVYATLYRLQAQDHSAQDHAAGSAPASRPGEIQLT